MIFLAIATSALKSQRMLPRHKTRADLAQVREHMSREGITQTEAAKRIGVTRWHLNRVLRGHRDSQRIFRAILAMRGEEVAK